MLPAAARLMPFVAVPVVVMVPALIIDQPETGTLPAAPIMAFPEVVSTEPPDVTVVGLLVSVTLCVIAVEIVPDMIPPRA
jgi:hypothetical protein